MGSLSTSLVVTSLSTMSKVAFLSMVLSVRVTFALLETLYTTGAHLLINPYSRLEGRFLFRSSMQPKLELEMSRTWIDVASLTVSLVKNCTEVISERKLWRNLNGERVLPSSFVDGSGTHAVVVDTIIDGTGLAAYIAQGAVE